jgi:hypothetical protein
VSWLEGLRFKRYQVASPPGGVHDGIDGFSWVRRTDERYNLPVALRHNAERELIGGLAGSSGLNRPEDAWRLAALAACFKRNTAHLFARAGIEEHNRSLIRSSDPDLIEDRWVIARAEA